MASIPSRVLTAIFCAASALFLPAISAHADTLNAADTAVTTTVAASAPIRTGWVKESPYIRYYDSNGNPVSGEYTIDGVTYLFSANGTLQTGWQTVSNQRRYFDPKTGESVTGWFEWRGETYYISEESGKTVGFYEDKNGKYYFDRYGVRRHDNDFIDVDDDCCIFVDANGHLTCGFVEINKKMYYFDEKGWMQRGFCTVNGCKRYFDPDIGEEQLGWLTFADGIMYNDKKNGLLTGAQTIKDTLYFFDKNGYLQTGFQTVDGCKRFFNIYNGAEELGWLYLEEGTMYSDRKNGLLTGVQTIDGNVYCFDENGILQTGFQLSEADGTYQYFGADGKRLTGFQNIDGNTYYFDTENGAMLRGLQVIQNKVYYFNADGIMYRGLKKFKSGQIYCFGDDGSAVSGIVSFEEGSFCFGKDGLAMTGLVFYDNVPLLIDADYHLATGFLTIDTATYYADADSHPVKEWQEIAGAFYYFDPDNFQMATRATIDGYAIDADGKAHTLLYNDIKSMLSKVDKTPAALYTYVINNFRYKKIEDTRTREQLNAQGWDKLVEYTVKNRAGVCYYLAATLDYFMQQQGMTTRIVHATHGTGDHYWNQVLVDGVWQNYDPTYNNRCNIAWDMIIARGSYTVYGFITVHYDARGTYTGTDFEAFS